MINEDEEAMPSERDDYMPHRAPYDPIPQGAKALGELAAALDETEFAAFWSALGDVIRFAAVAVQRRERHKL